MANIINLEAEIGANYIADDAQPALSFSNTGSGPGLKLGGLVLQSTASLDAVTVGGPILAANATITNLNVQGASRASGAVFALQGDAYTSVGSIDFAAGSDWAGLGAIRVVNSDGTFSWIPTLPDAAMEAVAAI